MGPGQSRRVLSQHVLRQGDAQAWVEGLPANREQSWAL